LARSQTENVLGIDDPRNRVCTFKNNAIFEPSVLDAIEGDVVLLGSWGAMQYNDVIDCASLADVRFSHCIVPLFVGFWTCTALNPGGPVMRCTLFSVILFALAAAGACAVTDETNAAPAKAKARQIPVAIVDTNALLSQTVWKGLLFAAPSDAATGVVAVLKQDKHQKTGFYLLRTEDPILATRMRELGLAHKGAPVVLNGRLDSDLTSLQVTEILELPKERKPERR